MMQKIKIGGEYRFGGYDWTVAEVFNDHAILQSHGVTAGEWKGADVTDYEVKTRVLYDAIKQAEYTRGESSGLFLVSKDRCCGYYKAGIVEAAKNAGSLGASGSSAWLGAAYDSSLAWFVNSVGYFSYSFTSVSVVVAPCFDLDLSKVEIIDGEIIIIMGERPQNPHIDGKSFVTEAEGSTSGGSPVFSDRVQTPEEYFKVFFDLTPTIKGRKNEVREILDSAGYSNLWDRPLSEIDEVLESGEPVVLVNCSYVEDGELVQEFRWFETPEAKLKKLPERLVELAERNPLIRIKCQAEEDFYEILVDGELYSNFLSEEKTETVVSALLKGLELAKKVM